MEKEKTKDGNGKVHVKKNDLVLVFAGNDKGKQGRVLMVFAETGRVIVEGVNIRAKHQKPNAKNPNGAIIRKEFSIHSSNVKKI